MLADGTGILDVGGASTRPGTELVTQEAEQQRVVPVLRELRGIFPSVFFCRYLLGSDRGSGFGCRS
jgi:dihydropteroate synthase